MDDKVTKYDNMGAYEEIEGLPTKRYVLTPMFKNMCGDLTNCNALDLACGQGYFTRILKRLGADKVLGVDLSKAMISDARIIESRNNLGIKYMTGDVATLDVEHVRHILGERIDLVSACYLFNYADSQEYLDKMVSKVSKLMDEDSRLVGFTVNPSLKPHDGWKYDEKVVNDNGMEFCDGDSIKLELNTKPKIVIYSTYWSIETYEKVFKNNGLGNIRWIKARVSDDGIRECGKEYWKDYDNESSPVMIGFEIKKSS